MENASKALLIAGAILLSILLIAIGIYVFNAANSTITSSMSSMDTQEREAFNNNFTTYQGKQSGSNVKSLLTRVASNLSTYKDESDKVPVVQLATKADSATTLPGTPSATTENYKTTDQASKYTQDVSKIRNKIKDKHQYSVQIRIGENGLILGIAIGDITNMNDTQIADAEDLLNDDAYLGGITEKHLVGES